MVLLVSFTFVMAGLTDSKNVVHTTPIAPPRVSSWIIQPLKRVDTMRLREGGTVLFTYDPATEASATTLRPDDEEKQSEGEQSTEPARVEEISSPSTTALPSLTTSSCEGRQSNFADA